MVRLHRKWRGLPGLRNHWSSLPAVKAEDVLLLRMRGRGIHLKVLYLTCFWLYLSWFQQWFLEKAADNFHVSCGKFRSGFSSLFLFALHEGLQ